MSTLWCDGMPLTDKRLVPAGRGRVWELDFLRGVFIVLMLVDHTFFDIMELFGAQWTFAGQPWADAVLAANHYWVMPLRDWVHDGVLWGFLVLCGLATSLTRDHVLRAAKLGVCAAILTVGTVWAQRVGLAEDIAIRWGVLHMLAVSCLVSSAVYSLTVNHRVAAVLVPLVLAAVLYLVNVLCWEAGTWPQSPAWLCVVSRNMGDYWAWTPGDFFPLLGDMSNTSRLLAVPYLSRVLVGTALVPLLYPARRSLLPRLEGAWCRPLCFLGRHTLWIVLVHQVVIAILLALMTGWVVTPGDYGLF